MQEDQDLALSYYHYLLALLLLLRDYRSSSSEWRFLGSDASLARALRAIWKRDGLVDDDAEPASLYLAVR